MNRTSTSFALVSILALIGCGGSSTVDATIVTIDAPAITIDAPVHHVDAGHIIDAAPDAAPIDATVDAAPIDATPPPDATPPVDAPPGSPDARPVDAHVFPVDARPDDARPVDARPTPDAHIIPDARPTPDASTAVSLNGCSSATATDKTGLSAVTVTFGVNNADTYTTPCIKVTAGTIVTFSGSFSEHPFEGGTVASNGQTTAATTGPLVGTFSTGTSKAFTMSTSGNFGYFCQFHVSFGMKGAIFVE